MPFGQVVVGPPGSGKTTYCHGLQQFFTATERPCAVINLDPGNDLLPYYCSVDICDLITVSKVMDEHRLGPNGALVYCIEYIEANLDWLIAKLKPFQDRYIIFDCPGQVELYTHHNGVKSILHKLSKLDYRLCSVHLVDSHYCTDPTKYVAMLLVSLQMMLKLELPHVNVLSKVDLMETYDKLDFKIDFYMEVQDLSYLLDKLNEGTFGQKYLKLNQVLCEVVEDFALVGFYTLCIADKKSVLRVVQAVDKANGFVFGGLTMGNDSILSAASSYGSMMQETLEIQEKYLASSDDEEDEIEIKENVIEEVENS
ncbi:hypothetical protein SmJEL517_g03249 [Synchytrium microbalum]|uniref:GPN-loop GTPase 2 n=1 Tax=Synchytrium microbalum TaxID=1806994 RepID=A0A507BXG5_9FUNG|nr:uncharacterized protein SmJEL517_g03249 [Synchytrium microbalum]TPX34010.1 hypothetical protein SmJEL517_g03249 [Synchytrium microbalum]